MNNLRRAFQLDNTDPRITGGSHAHRAEGLLGPTTMTVCLGTQGVQY